MGCSQSIAEQGKEIKPNESKQEIMREKNKNQLSGEIKSKECQCDNSARKNESRQNMKKSQKLYKDNNKCEYCRSNNPPQQSGIILKENIKRKSQIGNYQKNQKQIKIKQNNQGANAEQKKLIKQAQALTQSKCNFKSDELDKKLINQTKEANLSNRPIKSKKKYPDPIRKQLRRVYDI